MKNYIYLIALILVLFFCVSADANLLQNGDFETGSQAPWQQLGYHTGSTVDWAAYTGSYGYRITIVHDGRGDGWGGRYQNHMIQPGASYRFGGMINTDNITPSLDKAAVSLQIAFFSSAEPTASDTPIVTYDSELITDSGWSYLEVVSEAAPVSAHSVRFTYALWASDHQYFPGMGTAYYDDFNAEVVPEPSTIFMLITGLLSSFGFIKKKG
jgi:hypothetical protein